MQVEAKLEDHEVGQELLRLQKSLEAFHLEFLDMKTQVARGGTIEISMEDCDLLHDRAVNALKRVMALTLAVAADRGAE